jgi:hypothetical protein
MVTFWTELANQKVFVLFVTGGAKMSLANKFVLKSNTLLMEQSWTVLAFDQLVFL